jgi:hypothetical protein
MKHKKDGDGIMNNLKSLSKVRNIKDLKNHVVGVVKQDIQYANDIIFDRKHYSPKAQQILKEYGNMNITGLRICRVPLSNVIMSAFDFVTMRAFSERMKHQEYDKLFHLSLHIKLSNNRIIAYEKLEHVSLSLVNLHQNNAEYLEIAIIPDISLNVLLNNNEKYMGNEYFPYSGKSNNCQDFVLSCLKANHCNNAQYEAFIKQDTDALFNTYLRKLSNTVTDIGAKASIVVGGTIKKKNKTKKNLIKFIL